MNKNLAGKVLGLEKDLQAERKRRMEADKKLLEVMSAQESRGFVPVSTEQQDLQIVQEHLK